MVSVQSFTPKLRDLVYSDRNGVDDIFLFNVNGSTAGSLSRLVVTKNNRLVETNGGGFYPEINEDGSTVVFESDATNLTYGQPIPEANLRLASK